MTCKPLIICFIKKQIMSVSKRNFRYFLSEDTITGTECQMKKFVPPCVCGFHWEDQIIHLPLMGCCFQDRSLATGPKNHWSLTLAVDKCHSKIPANFHKVNSREGSFSTTYTSYSFFSCSPPAGRMAFCLLKRNEQGSQFFRIYIKVKCHNE